MTPARTTTAAIAAVVALAGCTTTGQTDGADSSQSTPDDGTPVAADVDSIEPDTPSPEPDQADGETDPDRSRRGNLVKEIGETAGIRAQPGAEPLMEFAVTDVSVDGDCTGRIAGPAENGHLLFVDISMSTAIADQWGDNSPRLPFRPGAFSIIGEDGLTEHDLDTHAAYSCLPDGDAIPGTIGPGENAKGTVVLDTANAAGTLVFRPLWVGDRGGWEWS